MVDTRRSKSDDRLSIEQSGQDIACDSNSQLVPLVLLQSNRTRGLRPLQQTVERFLLFIRKRCRLAQRANFQIHVAGLVIAERDSLGRNGGSTDVTSVNRLFILVIDHEIESCPATEAEIKLDIQIIELHFFAHAP